jgi:E3 ubiquitin-protein ligase UBR1
MIFINISGGNAGCCDCGDAEAWRLPVNCAIHTEGHGKGKQPTGINGLPSELVESIQMTIGRALDFLCDVISCSPEQLRMPKSVQSIVDDEKSSRLRSEYYSDNDAESLRSSPEFALVLWNDEKHTVREVERQVARACKQPLAFGTQKAYETDDVGRSIVTYSTDIEELLKKAKVIEHIKVTVTIRSARDTFREQMCGTIIEWLCDISGCTVGPDSNILRQTICEEFLKLWRKGSEAHNDTVGKSGIDDHGREDMENGVRIVDLGVTNRLFVIPAAPAAGEDGDAESPTNGQMDQDMSEADLFGEGNTGETWADEDDDVDMLGGPTTENDMLEASEATLAGFPPQPPPPPPRTHTNQPSAVFGTFQQQPIAPFNASQAQDTHTGGDSMPNTQLQRAILESTLNDQQQPSGSALGLAFADIPSTPKNRLAAKQPTDTPQHWVETPAGYNGQGADVPLHEDLFQRVRLDQMILFDLRMWKKARIDLRDLYISTVVTIPQFKRILGLRFAGLYTLLAQLYLIADREPDHSIINMSLQMLTTPSITAEVVERGNFLTNLMAIIYTFLSTRQVGYPHNVNGRATLHFDPGSLTNRRMYRFFVDLQYLFRTEYVQAKLREEEQYTAQFLDLVKLHQGICPNVRAVGEHVEYETDAWISASLITQELNRLCHLFSKSFRWHRGQDPHSVKRTIRMVAKVVATSSMGSEQVQILNTLKREKKAKEDSANALLAASGIEAPPVRPDNSKIESNFEVRNYTVFAKDVEFEYDNNKKYSVVKFVVEKQPISFHHALHYTLSWLIDCGKSLTPEEMRPLLEFNARDLGMPVQPANSSPVVGSEEYMLALFDFPLRVCAWSAQMRTGMWVRNGLSLRHQMQTYRGVKQRDVTHNRDIFLLQTAMVLCTPSQVLASIVERFRVDQWMRGTYEVRSDYDDSQLVDIAEDFIHLLVILLSDRLSLLSYEDEPNAHVSMMKRDIAHVLCFKPTSFSDLTAKLPEKFHEREDFQEILDEVANYRAPEGQNDTGSFELKKEYLETIDPYIAYYNKNMREEAENAYKKQVAARTGKDVADVVFEPKFPDIKSGLFAGLTRFTASPVFAQIIFFSITYVLKAKDATPTIPDTRLEAFLHVVLHLTLLATAEDKRVSEHDEDSFSYNAMFKETSKDFEQKTVLQALQQITNLKQFESCYPKVKLILRRLRERRPEAWASHKHQADTNDPMDTDSPASAADEQEAKRVAAKARQARILAQFKQQQDSFLKQNTGADYDEDDDYSDIESEVSGPSGENKIWKYPTDKCIMCRNDTNDGQLYGTFGLMTSSNILRQTPIDDPDYVAEVTNTPESLDRSAEEIRPYGVSGQNKESVRKIKSDGTEFMSERQVLGKGFPPESVLRGPVSVGCNHLMHYKCFVHFCDGTSQRHGQQVAREHPERLEFNEFVCPLCKALGNVFLPIIWKGKKQLFPGVLEPKISFEAWLIGGMGRGVSRHGKAAEDLENEDVVYRYRQLLKEYAEDTMVAQISNTLPSLASFSALSLNSPESSVPSSPSTLSSSSRFLSLGAAAAAAVAPHPRGAGFTAVFGGQPPPPPPPPVNAHYTSALSTPTLGSHSHEERAPEIYQIYRRLRNSLGVNKLESRRHLGDVKPDELAGCESLAKTLGFSISAIEIAQRGVESEPGFSLLKTIPSMSLTHLRVLSETVSSYIAVGALRGRGHNATLSEIKNMQTRQSVQLFFNHPYLLRQLDVPEESEWSKMACPLLNEDIFIFLVECSIVMVPMLNMDIMHIVRLCYMAEITKVVTAILNDRERNPETWWKMERAHSETVTQTPGLMNQLAACNNFIRIVRDGVEQWLDPQNPESHWCMAALVFKMASKYALPFLRKVAILLHVRHGVEPPNTGFDSLEEPELGRLQSLLGLPSIEEIFATSTSDTNMGKLNRDVIHGWLQHWTSEANVDAPGWGLSLSHPAILELVGLPKTYDTLVEEAVKQRCPTTGKEMVDPSVCLFCGKCFCSQAVCCTVKDKNGQDIGGCQQHLAECGQDVGLFINIRKCNTYLLHHRHGSWHTAPYLDKFGEMDPALRYVPDISKNDLKY